MKKILFIMIIAIAALACSKDKGSISGMASADDGKELYGITVKLYTEHAKLLTETTTDKDGKFAFYGLEAGNYYVAATVTLGIEVWDTGNTPQVLFVSDEIDKVVTLKLKKK